MGGTNKAAPEIALGLLGGCWRSDPGAVWQLAPPLDVARRCRTGNMPWASWNRAWAGTTRAKGPAGRCKEALAELGLGGHGHGLAVEGHPIQSQTALRDTRPGVPAEGARCQPGKPTDHQTPQNFLPSGGARMGHGALPARPTRAKRQRGRGPALTHVW